MQMALIARLQHPYIVEFKEAWVEKVCSRGTHTYTFFIFFFQLCLAYFVSFDRAAMFAS